MATTHGMYGTPTYRSWKGMKERCLNPELACFEDYGGRGVLLCERWFDFENFLEDMGPRPIGKTLDRHPDYNGNYEPGNCRWAAKEEQDNNRRSTKLLTFQGETHSQSQWARKLGLNRNVVGERLSRGWSVHRALTPVPHYHIKRRSQIGSRVES